MSNTATDADALDEPIAAPDPPAARPSTTLEPTRPEEERPDTEVGDIDDLPRPDWNDAPENASRSLWEPVDRP